MRYLLILLLATSAAATEVELDQSKDLVDEMKELVASMEEMTDKLRADETNTTVQIQGKEIDEKLQALIKEVESPYRKRTLKQSGRNRLLDFLKNGEPGVEPGTILVRRDDSKSTHDWANLPPDQRREIIQTWASELPVRWKNRIEAYFLSIAAATK